MKTPAFSGRPIEFNRRTPTFRIFSISNLAIDLSISRISRISHLEHNFSILSNFSIQPEIYTIR